jgi:hypothetical protein
MPDCSQQWKTRGMWLSSGRPLALQLRVDETAAPGNFQLPVSIAQAMLEADPTSREPQDSYLARYQTYARDELDQALSKYDQLQGRLGETRALLVRRGKPLGLDQPAAAALADRSVHLTLWVSRSAAGQDELQRAQRRDGMRLLRAAADSMLLRDNLNAALRCALRVWWYV